MDETRRKVRVRVVVRVGLGAVFAMAIAVGLLLAESAFTQLYIPPPPGDCDPALHSFLQAEVDVECSVPRSCKGTDDCSTLVLKRAQRKICRDARVTINQLCFRGGDPTHRDEVDKEERGIRRCDDLITSDPNCDDCPWIPL